MTVFSHMLDFVTVCYIIVLSSPLVYIMHLYCMMSPQWRWYIWDWQHAWSSQEEAHPPRQWSGGLNLQWIYALVFNTECFLTALYCNISELTFVFLSLWLLHHFVMKAMVRTFQCSSQSSVVRIQLDSRVTSRHFLLNEEYFILLWSIFPNLLTNSFILPPFYPPTPSPLSQY